MEELVEKDVGNVTVIFSKYKSISQVSYTNPQNQEYYIHYKMHQQFGIPLLAFFFRHLVWQKVCCNRLLITYIRCPRKNVPLGVVSPSSKGTFFLGHHVH